MAERVPRDHQGQQRQDVPRSVFTLSDFPPDAVANVTMETYFQGRKGTKPNPAQNRIGIRIFGTSCLHCHYQASQYDFSWMLADQAWPSAPGTEGTTKKLLKKKK